MATSYITTTEVDGLIGSARRQALFTPQGGSYDSTRFAYVAQLASVAVRIAAKGAGYTLGDTSTNETVQMAALGQFLLIAYGQKGEKVPEQFAAIVNLTEAIRVGQVKIVGLAPDAYEGVGGAKFTESATSITSSAPRIFSRKEQDLY